MEKDKLPEQLLKRARWLRVNHTMAENLLWSEIRNRKLADLKFRRQHPVRVGFILDFYCEQKKFGIELDGAGHFEGRQLEYDVNRTLILQEFGICIIRFRNDEILNDLQKVLQQIVIFANTQRLHANKQVSSIFWEGSGVRGAR